jgi:glycosyltransferase involved in cell wall biosynthesis
MKVLIVCRKKNGKIAPFISEQVESLRRLGMECSYFTIEKKGIMGYLSSLPLLKRSIPEFHPDLIHAHYGLSGLFATFQRRVPVVTTYHGSDINEPFVRPFSKLAVRRSRYNLFVSQRLMDMMNHKQRSAVIPCGVDLSLFYPMPKRDARIRLTWNEESVYILFAGNPNDQVKNYALAQLAVLPLSAITLVPLVGYSRHEVQVLLNAADVVLMTSFHEGSPQVIKEAMACNCPVVSTDVGDVATIMKEVDGCFVTSFDPDEMAGKLKQAIQFSVSGKRTNGRNKIMQMGLDLDSIAMQLRNVYQHIVQKS